MGIFLKKDSNGDYTLNKGAAAGAAFATLVGGIAISDSIVFTTPEYTTMVLTAGKPSRFAPVGPSLKIPFWETTYPVKTSLHPVDLDRANIALQNGTVTAEGMESTIFMQINGTIEEREQTISLLREKMPDYEARIKALAETALRNVVRLTVVASEESGEKQEVTATKIGDRLNFLDTKALGTEVIRTVQEEIDAIVPGTVLHGETQVPRIQITDFRLGQFDFDHDYQSRRKTIADSRAAAEAARYKKAEAERKAEAAAAEADGARRAAVLQAEGEAAGITLKTSAEAQGLEKRVKAAGGADKLREQTLAEKWDGRAPQVVGGSGVIVDGRFAPGVKDVTAPLASGPANDR
jgi:regulator of protease activity HflC (stomatin/prohibitin superfamily)